MNEESQAQIANEPASPAPRTRGEYLQALEQFDSALCDAIAVSQACSNRQVEAHKGWGTFLFTRLCAHGVALIRAVPMTRWVSSNFWHWDFSVAAGHARTILEAQLLISYVLETPQSDDAWSAKLNVMHLNDCTRRIKLFNNYDDAEQVRGFEEQADELRNRLRQNSFFLTLPAATQKRCLAGDNLMIESRDERLEALGWNRKHFNAVWDLLSQNTHLLPLSFYRMEPNGRGTGIENNTDRGYLHFVLSTCAEIIEDLTNMMVGAFPDTAEVRRGTQSAFSPGPRENAMRRPRNLR